jgi:hypothetical protein
MLVFNIAGLLVAIPRFFIWDRDRPGTVHHERDLVLLQHHHSGRLHGGGARDEAVAHHGPHQHVFRPVMARLADGRLIAGETIDMSRRQQHPLPAKPLELTPAIPGALAFPLPGRPRNCPQPWSPLKDHIVARAL